MMTSDAFNTIISEFNDIVEAAVVTQEDERDDIILFRARITFSSRTKLAMTDHLALPFNRRKYSYQWMDSDNTLIIRWDNSHFHDQVETAPHHKHVGKGVKAEASDEMDLRKVLLHIRASTVSE